ncbi:MAG TPA: RNA polymerase sigma factor, partial [Polyangiaceae bacterium]
KVAVATVALLVLGPSIECAADARSERTGTGAEPLPGRVQDITDVVIRARNGERSAFDHLAREFLRPAYVVALAIVRRPPDAEDVAQDALLIAFQRLDSCRDPSRFTAWLMTIVRNQAKNWLDKRRWRDVLKQPPDEASIASSIASAAPHDERTRILLALEGLSPAEREVVLLHDLQGYSHEEIGSIVGVSTVMSRQHLFVARRKLRQILGSPLGNSETEGCNE